MDMIEKVREIEAKAKSRSKSPVQTDLVGEQVQLPFWPEPVRGLPNALARSALFSVSNRNQRRHNFKNKMIASVKGVRIVYRGEELRQDDEDVFLQILHVARFSPLGDTVEVTAYSILKALGWGRSKAMYDRLKDCLLRLVACAITVSTEGEDKGFSGSLMRKFAWEGEDGSPTKTWKIWLEPEIIKLFGPDAYTQVYWEQRLQLSSPLARWLHGYYYTHQFPYPHKVETIRGLCGSRIATLADFRKKLRTAMDALNRIGFIEEWRIDQQDLLHVKRSPVPQRIAAARR